MNALARPLLFGGSVRLEPLTLDHVPALADTLHTERGTFGWTQVPTPETAETTVRTQLADVEQGVRSPYAQVHVPSGRVMGLTSYIFPLWAGGRLQTVEVGSTFLVPEVQGTSFNSESKLLMFDNAFESWGVDRVQICTDARNERSRAAIAAVGGVFEGIIRNYRTSFVDGELGQPRNTAMFSIVREEWPETKARLQARIATLLSR